MFMGNTRSKGNITFKGRTQRSLGHESLIPRHIVFVRHTKSRGHIISLELKKCLIDEQSTVAKTNRDPQALK